MARSKPTGASRVDRPANGAVGWLMRIRRGDVFIQEFFSDAAHGGKRKAQNAARERYQELAGSLPAARTSEGAMSVRNSSGVVGVRLAREGTNAAGEPRESYVASWRENGEDRTVRFSCSLFGKRKAFQLASLAREHRSTDREWLQQQLAAGKAKAPAKAPPKAAKAAAKPAAGKAKPAKAPAKAAKAPAKAAKSGKGKKK